MVEQKQLRMKSASFRDKPDTDPPPAAPSSDALFEISQDPVLSSFLAPDFNATLFASAALRSGSASASAAKLDHGLALLDKQLRSEITLRHPALLAHLSAASQFSHSLALIRSGVRTLQESAARIRSEVADPRGTVAAKTLQLSSIHQTLALLRAVVRLLRLHRRLRELLDAGGTSRLGDPAKAAQLVSEIEGIRAAADLSGIDIVDAENAWLAQAGSRIRGESVQMLDAGLRSLNQADVGGALQVFFNLGELRSAVEGVTQRYKAQAVKSVAGALDLKAISASVAAAATGGTGTGPGGVYRSGTPQIGSGAKARDGLWQRMAACFEQLHAVLHAVWYLERVLSNKRDPVSHVEFSDEVFQAGEPLITERVWEVVVKSFTSHMKSAFTGSSFVKEIFVLGYPKLLAMTNTFLNKLTRDTDVKGALPAVRDTDRHQLLATLEPFQHAYLAHILSRLTDFVNAIFSSARGGIPASHEPILKLVTRIQEELEPVKLDAGLTTAFLKEVGKVLQLFAEKAEYQMSTGPEARQVSAPATPSQRKNIALCLQLQELHQRLTTVLSSLPAAVKEALSQPLKAIHTVAVETISPLFKAMLERLEKSIVQLHEVDFSSSMSVEEDRAQYMQEIQEAAAHFRSEFLSRLLVSSSPSSISVMLVRNMASRVLVLFVRHAALVRPLSEHGKLRMAKDMAEVELVVAQNLFPVEQLGAAYKSLRVFKQLIFLEVGQIGSSPLVRDVPASVVLHHLYSAAPEELVSPMKRFKFSPAQYSLWLDSHSDGEVWVKVKATLDEYAEGVKARGDTHFSPVYPLMLQLAAVLNLGGGN